MKNNCKYLSVREMNYIQGTFKALFPDREEGTIIHEIESEYVHTDVVCMPPKDNKDKSVIVYTMGTSATVMPSGNTCELMTEFPLDAFIEKPRCEICDSGKRINEIIKPEYLMIIRDLISMSKMPTAYGDEYNNLETFDLHGRYYAIKEVFRFTCPISNHNKIVYYVVPLNDEELVSYADSFQDKFLERYTKNIDKELRDIKNSANVKK